MLSRKWARPLTLVAGLVLAVSACGGGGGQAEPKAGGGDKGKGDGALKLGYVLPETGELAFLGPPQIKSAEYAISQINKAGGVLGKDVPAIVAGDEAADTAVANQSADRVLAADVDAIVGAAASGMTLGIIDKVTGAGVVECSASNTAPNLTDYDDGGFYFRTAPSDSLQGPILAETVVADGHSNVAVVARADDYGKGLADATAQSLEEAGATVAVKSTYDPNAQNFDSVVQKISGAKPDATVLIAFEEGTQILQGMIEAGVGPDKIGVYGADGLRSEELGKLVSPDDPGIIAGMKGTAPASAENQEYTAGLKEFAPDLKELQFAPQSFDCVNIIALAAEQAGSDDPNVFKDEIVGVTRDGEECTSFAQCRDLIKDDKDIDYQGVSGPLDFIPQGEPGQARIEVYGYNDKGQLKTVDTVLSRPAS
ncbi:MAG: ABC transporter substrate-binding protein [Streptomycetales bacterium]